MLYKFSQIFETTMNSFFEGFMPTPTESIKADKVLSFRKDVMNIFLIEDNTVDELYLRQSLEKLEQKIKIYSLRTLEDVTNILRKQIFSSHFPRPDLILLDLQLQKNKGLGILKLLKQDNKTKDIPVIMLSNSLEKADIIESYKLQASGYINKAFDYDIFQDNLKITVDYWTKAVLLPY